LWSIFTPALIPIPTYSGNTLVAVISGRQITIQIALVLSGRKLMMIGIPLQKTL
jgi:hypothetical protein